MGLKERVYSVLIVSASPKFNDALTALMNEAAYEPVSVVSNVSAANRSLVERSYDFVIVNSPLPDDNGMGLAIDVCRNGSSVSLLLVKEELHAEIQNKVSDYGVFTLPKPTSKPYMQNALNWMASARERLRKSEKKTLSIEEKMEEIRAVNKAKWILITDMGMSEDEAHRFIEKTAMDRCVTKRSIAREIIENKSRLTGDAN